MLRNSFVLFLVAASLGVVSWPAQAAQKIVSVSICAGSDCKSSASQHNFTHPGTVRVPSGLQPAIRIARINYSCAAFCSHAVLWPQILIEKGHDGSYFTLDAHHVHSVNESSSARSNVYTLSVWLHY